MKEEYALALQMAKVLEAQLKSLLTPQEANVPSMEGIIYWITNHGNQP